MSRSASENDEGEEGEEESLFFKYFIADDGMQMMDSVTLHIGDGSAACVSFDEVFEAVELDASQYQLFICVRAHLSGVEWVEWGGGCGGTEEDCVHRGGRCVGGGGGSVCGCEVGRCVAVWK